MMEVIIDKSPSNLFHLEYLNENEDLCKIRFTGLDEVIIDTNKNKIDIKHRPVGAIPEDFYTISTNQVKIYIDELLIGDLFKVKITYEKELIHITTLTKGIDY